MRFLKNKLFTILTLMLCMGVFCVPVFVSAGEETLNVNAVWIDGELLRINVTDADGVSSALALRLSDYVNDAENKEFISIQAVDLAGNMSGVIEIKNPFYSPASEPKDNSGDTTAHNEQPQSSASAISDDSLRPAGDLRPADGHRPFTPDGTGSVIDNAHDGDGKEFFTIGTEDGNVFYLIVDRQRNADNVYLLNAVTEEDLMALAERSGREINTNANNGSTSAIPMPEPVDTAEEQHQPVTAAPAPEPETQSPSNNGIGRYAFIAIAVLIVGGAGYYFKIVKGRNNPTDDEDDYEGDYGYDDEPDDDYGGDDPEKGDDKE